MGHGYLSKNNAFRKLKGFREEMIAAYTQSVCKNKMNRIKPKTLARENDLISKFSEYFNLGKIDQIENLVYFCVNIGSYTSNLTVEYYKYE